MIDRRPTAVRPTARPLLCRHFISPNRGVHLRVCLGSVRLEYLRDQRAHGGHAGRYHGDAYLNGGAVDGALQVPAGVGGVEGLSFDAAEDGGDTSSVVI